MSKKRKPQPGDIYARHWSVGGKGSNLNTVLIDANGRKLFLKESTSGIINGNDLKESSMAMGTSDYILIGTLQDLEDTIIKEVFGDG